jgi:hypothetical protein
MAPGTPIDLGKLRTIGMISRRTRPVVTDARRDDGVRVKVTTTDEGRTVEHNTRDDRVDAIVTPQTLTVTREQLKEQTHA